MEEVFFFISFALFLPVAQMANNVQKVLFSLHLPCFFLLYPFPITIRQSFAVSLFFFVLFCFFFFLFAFTDTHGGSELLWRKTKSRLIIEHSLLLLFIFFRPWLLLVLWLSQFLCGCILTGLVLLYPFSLSWTTVTSYRAQAPLLTPRPHQPLLSTPQ